MKVSSAITVAFMICVMVVGYILISVTSGDVGQYMSFVAVITGVIVTIYKVDKINHNVNGNLSKLINAKTITEQSTDEPTRESDTTGA